MEIKMQRSNWDLLKAEITRDEGKRNKLYQDSVGIWTIGVGYNIQEHGLPDDIIDELLNRTLGQALADAEALLNKFGTSLEEHSLARQRAIVNMMFNMGMRTLGQFKNTLTAFANKDYDKAAQGVLNSKYARQVGQRAVRVAQMIKEG